MEIRPHPLLLPPQDAPATLVEAAVTPFVAIGTLFVCTLAFNHLFTGLHLILALIVFAFTFPGAFPQGNRFGALAVDVLVNWALVVGLLFFIGWTTRTIYAFDPQMLAAWVLATPVVLLAANLLFPVLMPRVLSAQGAERTAVIAGEGTLGRTLAESLRKAPHLGIRFAGYFDDRDRERMQGSGPDQTLGSLNQLPDYVKQHHVDIIYITLPMASQPRLFRLFDALRDTTASIYFVPDIFLFDMIQARMDAIGGIPVIAVCETPFHGVNGLMKSVSDVVLASAILILVSPLMLAIAAAIRLTSPGPAIFTQRRYGLDGREIIVYKFRTMTVLEDGEVIPQATRGDRRVTPLGAILRRTSLDELPQFINVLQGRMSVVGPRPHAVAHNELYRKLIKGYMVRHKVKPGITGLAQVSGLRGETDSVDKMRARIECDLAYLRNWSLALDLQIVLRTIPAALMPPENAY